MGKPRILVFAVVASLGLAACGGTSGGGGTPTQNKPTKVQIAAEGPFTGDEASIGAGALQAIKLAVKDFNNKGGVHGTPVTLIGDGLLAEEHARRAGTITYELVSGIRTSPERAARVVVDG